MITKDKIMVIDLCKIPKEISMADYVKHLQSLDNPELIDGVSYIDRSEFLEKDSPDWVKIT